MAKRREPQEDLGKTKRISPYQQIEEEYLEQEQYAADEYMDEYEDEYDASYDEPYAPQDDQEEEEQKRGFFSTLPGRIALIMIVLLFVLLVALLAVRFLKKPGEPKELPGAQPAVQEATSTPDTIVFAPQEPTSEPTAVPTPMPTAEPEPTHTPLPIILTNTPTPSPSPTPTPTPSPTPVPTPTPTPEPTEVPSLAKGEVNRNANLREGTSSSAKVKQTVKKGETVTVHESLLDKGGKIWYRLTADDLAVSGFMRDYVVDLETKIAKPTYTPRPEETPNAEDNLKEEADSTGSEQIEPGEPVLAAGRTNRDANLRKSMNGTVLGTIKWGKSVNIFEVLKDKKGNLWYRLDAEGKAGYMRDYVIDLDDEQLELVPETDVTKVSVGTGRTNRAANVRKTPSSDGEILRQISKGTKLYITGRYQDDHKQIWYQISTESGNTKGFMRDYVLDNVKLDAGVETQSYQPEETEDEEQDNTAA